MRTKRILPILISIFSFCSLSSFAQVEKGTDTTKSEDLSSLLEQPTTDTVKHKKEYVRSTFKDTRLVTCQSVETTGQGVLDFRIWHRFGELSGGLHNFFGLDNANTMLGFDYGILNWLMVGVGRATYDREYYGFVKAKVLRQTEDNRMPVTVDYYGSVSVSDRDIPQLDAGQTYYFSNRVYYTNQLLIAHKFSRALSLQLMPTQIHYNLVNDAHDKNDVFAIGGGGRMKLTPRLALTAEYYFVIPGSKMVGTTNALTFGLEVETGGHVFSLNLGNSSNLTDRTYIGQTTGTWFNNVHFGFNISRVFTIVSPKGMEGARNSIY